MEITACLVNRPPPVIPAAAVKPPEIRHSASGMQRQSYRVSSSGDAAEVEAHRVARSIVTMPAPSVSHTARSPKLPQRAAAARTTVPAPQAPQVSRAPLGAGKALPEKVRRDMEPRFQADFSRIRLHTDEHAAALTRQMHAHAVTIGENIYFAPGQFSPDTSEGRELLAHELTHTIQQGAAQQTIAADGGAGAISERSSTQAQRLSKPRRYIADKAAAIPGFTLLTVIMGRNPITDTVVQRSAGNILRGLIELIPGGALITQALNNYGVFDRATALVDKLFASLIEIGTRFVESIQDFISSLGVSDIFSPGSVWDRACNLMMASINRVRAFASRLVGDLLELIRNAILRPLAGLAEKTRGWNLLCAVLGRNPITGNAVPRTPDALIGGFMRLIGREEIWENLQRSNAVGRAWNWFQRMLEGLMGFVRTLPSLFLDTLRSLGIADLLVFPQTFGRVFGDFAGRFSSWAGQQTMGLLEIIFEVVAPAVMPYLRKAAGAMHSIITNPIRFLGYLVQAGGQGFRQFAANFVKHLRASLIGWLTGSLGGLGVYIPKSLGFQEIVKFVFSVLGVTWASIRNKLVRVVGEKAMTAMETGFDFVVTLVREGPAAAWERLQESLGNLRDMVMERIMNFVRDNIVTVAIMKLLSLINPAGAFIQAVIGIYNTIMFFVERLRQIAQVVASVIDSLAAIANGIIAAAANRVEQTMAGMLTLVISFLAHQVGLGKVGDAVAKTIERIRTPIDKAIDHVVNWIVKQAKNLGNLAKEGVQRLIAWWQLRKAFHVDGEEHSLYFAGEGENRRLMMASSPEEFEKVIRDFPPGEEKHLPPGKEKHREKALDLLKELKSEMQKAYGKGSAEEKESAAKKIDKLLEELAPVTARFMGYRSPEKKSTQPIFGGIGKSGFGTWVRVEYLTFIHKPGSRPGSPPSENKGVWKQLKRRKHGGQSYYVLGHLLSEKLGGPGKFENLTPLTQASNNSSLLSMEREVEKPVKNTVGEGHTVVDMEVKAIYGNRSRNKAKKFKGYIEEIIEVEAHVPTAIEAKADFINAEGERKTLVDKRIDNFIDTDHYYTTKEELDVVYLNDSPRNELKKLNGVDDTAANEIIKLRPFKVDRNDACARIGERLWHKMVSTAGFSIRFNDTESTKSGTDHE